MRNKYLSLFIILIITFVASAIGGFTTSQFKEPWYSSLTLSPYNPPSWVFGPVWTTLYVFMSVAIWKVWTKFYETKILIIYFIHILFNASWSVVFFGFHEILLSLINLIIILAMVIYLTIIFKSRDNLSFLLMVPYLLWSSYALFLNASILILN
jgi:benzodiazapine receptor